MPSAYLPMLLAYSGAALRPAPPGFTLFKDNRF